MIHGISSGQQNNDWLRKKLLERQAQNQAVQSVNNNTNSASANIQPDEQINGTNQVKASEKASVNVAQASVFPWTAFMNSLGLSPGGSKEADMSAIGEKIAQMKAQATDPTQKAKIEVLEQQYKGYEAVAANMPSQSSTASQAVSTAADNMTGATQLGEYNKLFIKKRQPEENYS